MARPRGDSSLGVGQHPRPFITSVARYWKTSYAPDYAGFVLLLAAYFVILLLVEPFHRMFSLDNVAIHFPHAIVERVPTLWNIIYAGVVPLVILLLWMIVSRPGWHKAHVTILGLFISLILASFLTDVAKNSVGRPRPDLIARCKPASNTPVHELVTISVCTEKDHHTLQDGWRSFPSGHSSFAFSGLGYLAMFFAGQMHVFRPRADLSGVLVALLPLVGAALIAISRCEDYRHDVYDVTVGSLLGLGVAYFSYRRYYPKLTSPRCDRPYPTRAEAITFDKGRKHNDEEEAVMRSSHDFDADELEDSTHSPEPESNKRLLHSHDDT